MLSLLSLDGLAGLLAGALALLAAMAGFYLRGRSTGRNDAETRAREADHAKSKEIEAAADRARANDDAGGDSLERLRQRGRVRD